MATEIALPKQKNETRDRRTWHGMAFIMEALILLVFLMISIAVLMQVFAAARTHGQDADALSHSVILASNEAERFSANPTTEGITYYMLSDGVLAKTDNEKESVYQVTTTTEANPRGTGMLYLAHISIEHAGVIVYEVDTARYVEGLG